MWNKKSFSLFFIIVITITAISSCIEANKSLGGQFLSEDFVLKLKTEEFDIPLTSSSFDSIPATSSQYLTFGYLYDEQFGYLSSGAATHISTYGDSTYLGINPELKSIYLYLNIDSVGVLQDNQKGIPQNIYLYKLTSKLDSLKMYNTSISPEDYDPTPISVGSPLFFGDDSIKIYLSEEYGKELLATTVAEFDSLSLFMERIKGIYITTDNPNIEPGSGRLNYSSIGQSAIYVRYLLTDPQRGWYKKDTTITFSLGYSHSINTFKSSSKHLENKFESESVYIDSFDGVKPMIKGKDIKNILNTWISKNSLSKNGVLISRAALVFPFEFDINNYTFFDNVYPPQIYPCTKSISGNTLSITPLPEIYNSTNVGTINRALNNYTCEVTKYIQEIVKKDEVTDDDDLYICPIHSYTTSSSYYSSGSTYFVMDNINYRHGRINGSLSHTARPRLEITYSILNRF